MNRRVYDPLTGVFLSPDNYIQSPDFTQNYNRYGYCFNNPLKFTDPTGYTAYKVLMDELYGEGNYWYRGQAPGTWGGGGDQGGSGSGGLGITISWETKDTYIIGTRQEVRDENNILLYILLPEVGVRYIRSSITILGTSIFNYASGQGGEHGESPLLEYAGMAGYVSHGMIGTAAELTAQTSYKYGQRVYRIVKSAAQITAENKILWGTVAKGFNATGGIIGAGVNGYKAYNDYSEGNYGIAAFNGSKALSYIGGTICLFIPGLQGVGGYILVSTLVVDVAGDVVKANTGH